MQLQLIKNLKKIFALTQGKLLYSFVVALIIFVVEYLPYLYHVIEGEDNSTRGYLGQMTSEILAQKLSELSSRPYADVATVMVLYVFIGALVLAIYIGLQNVFVLSRNEVKQKFGKNSSKLGYFIFARKISRYMLLISFLLLSFTYLPKYWTGLLDIFVYSGMSLGNIGYFLAGFIGLSLNIYVAWVAIQLVWFHQKTYKTL